jgi:hypothetical protein
MMEAVCTSETSVNDYFTRQYIPEDNSEEDRRYPGEDMNPGSPEYETKVLDTRTLGLISETKNGNFLKVLSPGGIIILFIIFTTPRTDGFWL